MQGGGVWRVRLDIIMLNKEIYGLRPAGQCGIDVPSFMTNSEGGSSLIFWSLRAGLVQPGRTNRAARVSFKISPN